MSKPEKVFKAGAVRASIFRNTIERNGKPVSIAKVVLEVRYKDKNGEWKSSNSFSLNELPKASTALRQAYEYLLGEGASREFDSDDQASGQQSYSQQPKAMSAWVPGKHLYGPESS